eukprot:scaffold22103_cov72-Phaeocystis_antarctica.AAC.3
MGLGAKGLSRGPADSLTLSLVGYRPQLAPSSGEPVLRAFSRQHGHSHRVRAQLRWQRVQPIRRGAGTRAATVVPRVVGLLRLLCLEDHLASAARAKGAGFPAHGRRWQRPPPATPPPHASLALHTHCTVQ